MKKGYPCQFYHFGLGENDFLAFNAQLFKDRVNEMKFENLLRVF